MNIFNEQEKWIHLVESVTSTEEIYLSIKSSLEDYESQGGKVTKKMITSSVEEFCNERFTSEDKKKLIARLNEIFIA